MSSLQIDRVTGGFIVTTPTERGVACSVHALVAAVQVWATSEAMDYETTLACAAPPTVAPDAAPAPFRVGDRVVFVKERTAKAYGNGPFFVSDVKSNGCYLKMPPGQLPCWQWFDNDELHHAPEEA